MAKSLSSTNILLSVSKFIKVLFPAFVYPTKATVGYPIFFVSAYESRRILTAFNSFSISNILCRICRLSVSSFVSPGPLVSMPPPSLDRVRPIPVSLGRRYLSWASSTCSLPSFELALLANISRIRDVLSMTLIPIISSRFLICAADNSSSNIIRSI